MITKKTKTYGVLSLLFFVVVITAVIFSWQYVILRGDELVHEVKVVADSDAQEQVNREVSLLGASTQDERMALTTYLLTEEETITFLGTIEQTALEQGVVLATESLKVTKGTDVFDTLVISFSVEGLKANVYNMLHLLETLPYHAYVTKTSFSNTTTNGVVSVKGPIELTISLLRHD